MSQPPADTARRILVEVKRVYSNDLVYPADDTARTFAALTGKKTFTAADLGLIRQLGYQIAISATQELPDGYGSPDAIVLPGGAVAQLP